MSGRGPCIAQGACRCSLAKDMEWHLEFFTPITYAKTRAFHVQSSQLRDTVVSGHCDTESLKRALQGFVEHGGIKVYISQCHFKLC